MPLCGDIGLQCGDIAEDKPEALRLLPHLFKSRTPLIEQRNHGTPLAPEDAHGERGFLYAIRHTLKAIRDRTENLIRRKECAVCIVYADPETVKDIPGIVRITFETRK